MRIAYLAARHSIHTVRWVNALAEMGHEVHLVTLHEGGDPLHPEVKLYVLPHGAPLGYFLNAAAARKIISKIKPDVLSVHYASGYGTLGRLVGFHPYTLSVWGSDVFAFPDRSRLHRSLVISNLRAADHVCSTSRAMAKRVHEVDPELGEISVTPFGIDTQRFCPGPSQREDDEIVVGCVKTLSHNYAIDVLLRSFAALASRFGKISPALRGRLRLLLVGEGVERPKLEALVGELELEGMVTFAGATLHEKVPHYLRRMDVFVAISRNESFGVAVLEASACGIPVVVSDVGGLPEVVEGGKTGIIVPCEDVAATTDALERLVLDEDLRRTMGEAGRRMVLERYDWTKNVKEMEAILSASAKRHPDRSKQA